MGSGGMLLKSVKKILNLLLEFLCICPVYKNIQTVLQQCFNTIFLSLEYFCFYILIMM